MRLSQVQTKYSIFVMEDYLITLLELKTATLSISSGLSQIHAQDNLFALPLRSVFPSNPMSKSVKYSDSWAAASYKQSVLALTPDPLTTDAGENTR